MDQSIFEILSFLPTFSVCEDSTVGNKEVAG